MKALFQSKTVSTGLAMFAMFFGAGNVVFPLALGQYAQDKNFFAILGLSLSAIAVPFAGLIAMILFNGNYKAFFGRIGKVPGFIVALFIMCLIGPFGAIPRCIALSYSTMSMFLPPMSLPIFSIASCFLILLFTIKPSKILDVLGLVLTPFLLFSLGVIIVVGLVTSTPPEATAASNMTVFISGLMEGYHTMDLLGAFFFSAVVISCLQKDLHPTAKEDYKQITVMSLKASAIGAFLLGLIYVGFSYVSAYNSEQLSGVGKDLLLGTIALNTLGPYAGIVTSIAVALACLTTAIALASVFAEFLNRDIFRDKINYTTSLIITLVTTFFISTLNFTGIVNTLGPILAICYPALILLSILNLAYKLYNFQPVKTPVFMMFAFSIFQYFYLQG
ncbi:MAG: branched-chain amino acid transport system II carrier protein [Chlamydiota bacterium]|nr:branched-chain amino acid transport system II carrier protein [Chlamydiota bacterium]